MKNHGLTILKKFWHANAVFKPGMEQHFLATSPTKARQRELKKKGKIAFEEAVPVAASRKLTDTEPEPEQEAGETQSKPEKEE